MNFVPSVRSRKSGPTGFAAALLATTALVALVAQPALAQIAWEGAASNDWFDGDNWDGSIAPGVGDQVHIDTFILNSTLIAGGAAQSGDIAIGYNDFGILFISFFGGTLQTTGSARIGQMSASNGIATVLGEWAIDGDLTVGDQGHGTLRIENGAAVENAQGLIGFSLGSAGDVTVTGAGSEWINAINLAVGVEGRGTLFVADGGAVENGFGSIGFAPGSIGEVTVTGPGSEWKNAFNLHVGQQGNGTLLVENGGAVTSSSGYIGFAPGSTGAATVTGAGSSWTNISLFVGNQGNGTLDIADGGVTASGPTVLGAQAGGLGTVRIMGAGSALIASGTSRIGQNGQGDITITDGGALSTSGAAFVGEGTGAQGAVTVDGAASRWFADGDVGLGVEGTGILNIQNGGIVTGAVVFPNFYLGEEVGGEGHVFIGNGILEVMDIEIGHAGFGTVMLDAGANVNSLNTTIGVAAGGEGVAVVGNGGSWENDGDLVVGGSGHGTLTIDEGGILTNGIFLPGDVTVAEGPGSSGTLIVNGLLDAGLNDIVINTGGILGGSGNLIGNTIIAGGTVAPGNSIGTLNVLGDFTFDPGSIYEVEVNAAGDSDLIHATGTVTLDGGTVLVLPFPDYALETQYTIVTADGGIAGAGFDEAVFGAGSLFITPVLSDDANNVYLMLSRTADFADAALTPNQSATASGIQSVGSGALFSAVAALGDADDARAAFDASSGEIHASAMTALIEDSRFIRNAANDRIRSAFATAGAAYAPVLAYGPGETPALASPDHEGLAFWGHGFGSWGVTDNDGNAAGLDRSTGGLLLGVDTLVGDWRLGVLGGYSHSGFAADDRASFGSGSNYHFGLYGGTQWDDIAFRTGAAYTWHDMDFARSVAFPGFADSLSADYGAHTFQAFGELGYGIALGADTRFEPFANLAHVHLNTSSFGEQGGAAALFGADGATGVSFTTLGVRGEHNFQFGTVDATLRGMIGWQHAFGDTTPQSTHALAGGNAFSIAGVPITRNSALIEAGFDLDLTPDATFGLSYSGRLSGSVQDHGFRADLSVRF